MGNKKLYFITDSTGFDEEEFLMKVDAALNGGVDILQLREKEKSTRDYINLAKKVHVISKKYNVPLIIDDRVDVALAVDAEGVHLGQSDISIDMARKIMGNNKIIGATAKTVDQAFEAFSMTADYLGVGAIYPTTTKVKTVLTSTQTLSKIIKAVPIPVYAIGGLNKDNIKILNRLQIEGVCVVSAIIKAENPKQAVKEIKGEIEKI